MPHLKTWKIILKILFESSFETEQRKLNPPQAYRPKAPTIKPVESAKKAVWSRETSLYGDPDTDEFAGGMKPEEIWDVEGAKRREAWEEAMNRSSWNSTQAKNSPSGAAVKTVQQRPTIQNVSQAAAKQSGEERKLNPINSPTAKQASAAQLYGAKKPASTGRSTDYEKWGVSAETMLDYCLSNGDKFTKEEKQVAKAVLRDLKWKYNPQFSKYKGNRDGIGAEPLPKDLKLMQRKITALDQKVSFWLAAEAGLHDSITFGFGRQGERESAEKRYAYYNSLDRPLTEEEATDYLILQSQGGRGSFDVMQEQNWLAYGGGNLTGETLKYAIGNAALGAVPGLGEAIGKVGNAISAGTKGKISAEVAKNLVSGRVTDALPDLVRAAQTTDNPLDFMKQLGMDQAVGLLVDGGLEGVSYAWKQLRNHLPLPKSNGAKDLQKADSGGKLEAGNQSDVNVPKRRYEQYALLKKSTCTPAQLDAYLAKNVGSDAAKIYRESGTWPTDVQIPKGSVSLTKDGGVAWERAPRNGFVLDAKGEPIKKPLCSEKGRGH